MGWKKRDDPAPAIKCPPSSSLSPHRTERTESERLPTLPYLFLSLSPHGRQTQHGRRKGKEKEGEKPRKTEPRKKEGERKSRGEKKAIWYTPEKKEGGKEEN